MKKVILGLTLVGVAAAVTLGFLARDRSAGAEAYRVVTVERGDVVSTVSATGTLNAVSTVQVGTQVSGQIAQLFADFNDHVRRGQLVARLDSTLLALAVRQARAEVERAEADVLQKRFLFEQAARLAATQSVTETELRTAEYSAAASQANLRSAQASLERAEQNLRYADIHAPIDGIVIERNVSVGQTVAASLSAPQLYLIAEDLSRMQILVSVDESDIGRIREGQTASFTVQAYPNRTFTGTVRQVRMQSRTSENVVNYTVVVGVENRDQALLPGMTATVTFEIARSSSVLKVANAALRFRPTEAMLTAWRQAHPDTLRPPLPSDSTGRGMRADSTRPRLRPDSGAVPRERPANLVQLWYLDEGGAPAMTFARTGISDGLNTEIRGRGVAEGMRLIAGLASNGAAASSTATNPFQGNQQQRMGTPPPPGAF